MASKTGTAVAKTKPKAVSKDEPALNFFEQYGAAAGRQSNIVGSLLRFTKGEYVFGQAGENMPLKTNLAVNMLTLVTGWTRWDDNKPVESIMGPIADGYQPKRRDELGFDDQTEWELDDKQQPRDPWQFGNNVIMRSVGKRPELFTFTVNSKGGLGAIGKLCSEYGREMRERPDEFPVVELGRDFYMHSNKSYGKIWYPVLEIVDWIPEADFEKGLQAAAAEEAPRASKKLNRRA